MDRALVQGPRCGRLWLPVDDELEGLEGTPRARLILHRRREATPGRGKGLDDYLWTTGEDYAPGTGLHVHDPAPQKDVDVRGASAFTRVFDALCAGMTIEPDFALGSLPGRPLPTRRREI